MTGERERKHSLPENISAEAVKSFEKIYFVFLSFSSETTQRKEEDDDQFFTPSKKCNQPSPSSLSPV